MGIDLYSKKLSKERYFEQWDREKYDELNEALKDLIYTKYSLRYVVFNRDNFKCQNINCVTPDSKITMHHIKWKKNHKSHENPDKERNCVTLCDACHKAFNRAKKAIVFGKEKHLPAHIRGHTFKLEKPLKADFKFNKIRQRQFRKSIKDLWHLNLTWEQVAILLKFLELSIEE
jgi:hypothetical protein